MSTQQQLLHHQVSNSTHSKNIILILDSPNSPANIGLIIRTAEAMGVKEIIIFSNEISELSSKIKRISRSAFKYLSIKFTNNFDLKEFKEKNYKIVALEQTQTSISIKNFDFDDKINLVLIIGNENYGVSAELLNQVSECLHIPMFGKNSSMNVATATAIALWEIIENS